MIGYCCLNMTLDKNQVNRTMRKATFKSNGLSYVSKLSLQNLNDMFCILKWNVKNDILLYRMSSDMFPWMSEYEFSDLPNFKHIKSLCKLIGNYAKEHQIRLSFHPGQFNVLGSNNPTVVKNTIISLNKHAQIMNMMELGKTYDYPINVHVSAINPNKKIITTQFCRNFEKLDDDVKLRLTIENDDKPNQYTPKELFHMVHKQIGIPLTFDQFHFTCGQQDTTMKEALEICLSTWGNVKPLTHHSSSKRIELNDNSIKTTAHSDFILDPIQNFGYDFDTDIEAKCKDKAVLKYKKDFL